MDVIKILVVDDNRRYSKTIADYLITQSMFAVVGIAYSGTEALSVVDDLNPDLVLLDFNMPGMNGIETANQLWKKNPEIGIIINSIQFTEILEDAALEVGAGAFLPKDLLASKLFSTINNVINKYEPIN